MNKKFITLSFIFGLISMLFGAQAQTPNILLITADDMDYNSIGVNGCTVEEISPNIDRLASEGIRFTNAHVTVAVCEPSRGVIGTGQYPNNSGIVGFYPAEGDIPTLAEELKSSKNYFNGIMGKVKHSTPKEVEKYVWDFNKDSNELASGRSPRLYKENFKKFIQQAKSQDRPFFMMANSNDPHRPFFVDTPNYERNGRQRPSRIYKPEEIVVPGFLHDLPKVREELAAYFSSVKRCDDTVGALLEALEEEGIKENTIVVFLSDNGMAFPFAKSNVYYQSTRTPFIVRWAGEIKAGKVEDKQMVSMVDLMPTLLDAVGVDVPEECDGRSFLSILKGKKQNNRDLVFTHYNESSATKCFPMRAVQSEDYLYIFNPWAVGGRQYKTSSVNGKSFEAMKEAGVTDTEIQERVDFCLNRTVLEFYDLKEDPNGLNNLAGNADFAKKQENLEGEMLRLMKEINDPLLPLFEQKDNTDYLIQATAEIQKVAKDLKKERRKKKPNARSSRKNRKHNK